MEDRETQSLDQIRAFLEGSEEVRFQAHDRGDSPWACGPPIVMNIRAIAVVCIWRGTEEVGTALDALRP